MADWPRYGKTRFASLGITKTGKVWRFVDLADLNPERPSCVGPQYATKIEALSDLSRYASDAGWN